MNKALVRLLRRSGLAILLPGLALSTSQAQDANVCDQPGEAPDLIVGDLSAVERFGTVGDISAYSVGTVSCNIGTCWADWIAETSAHPVIAQNMYRLKDGRFEQIGQSWLKHGFFALSQSFCSSGCVASDGDHLGVNCSDPYSSGLNGSQARLGPRFEVNPTSGEFPFPFTTIDQTGDAIYKRLQVHNVDLDPALNPGALYFVEGHYVSADDAAAGNSSNNASYRPVTVSGSGGVYDVTVTGTTVQQSPAVFAWGDAEPQAKGFTFKIPGEGQYTVFAKVTDLGDGFWNYEYAIHNMNSHRGVGSVRIPLPAGAQVRNIGFHDVDYHSGEPYDGGDWVGEVVSDAAGDALVWSTDPYELNPDANALRWGTLYNFRFDADVAPLATDITLGFFLPGLPAAFGGQALAPNTCNGNGLCEAGESCDACADCLIQVPGPQVCGDGTCEPGIGEDCVSCPEDCNGQQSGNPGSRFCCGDGDGTNPVACTDLRCSAGAFECGASTQDVCCGDGLCDPLEDSCACALDCGAPPASESICDDGLDEDCDGLADCGDLDCCTDAVCADGIDADGDGVAECDCDDGNDQVWTAPTEVTGLQLSPGGPSGTVLDWMPPAGAGGTTVLYEVLRTESGNFETGAACLTLPDPEVPTLSDMDVPPPGGLYRYLARAVNGCSGVSWNLGVDSAGSPRAAIACP